MQVDARTLSELGVTPSPLGDWPLAPLLDHTRDRHARHALKRLLGAPLDSPAEIRRRQAMLRALPEALAAVRMEIVLALASSAADYLASNRIHVPPGRVERTAFRLRHPGIVAFVESGIDDVSRLLETTGALLPRLTAIGGDRHFVSVVRALQHVLDSELPASTRAMRVGTPSASRERITLDGWIRGAMRAPLESLVQAVYELEAFASLARTAATPGFVVPDIVEEGPLRISNAWHPLLPTGARNDITLALGDRVLFLTGPNMAGKSTLLRTIGAILLLAHLGLSVPATAASIPFHDRLISSLRVEDDLSRGESLYLAEVRRVRAVVNAVSAGDRVAALLDEAFRGTNIKDATDAMSLLVDGLAAAPHGVFVLASHLAEVAHARTGAAGVALAYMAADADPGGARFTYRLCAGVSDVRLGVHLLEQEGVVAQLRALVARRVAAPMA